MRVYKFALPLLSPLFAMHACMVIAECQKPNPNTVHCISDEDLKTAAGVTIFYANCQSAGTPCSSNVYERANFPDGTVASDEGTTAEETAECWRSVVCQYDPDGDECVVDEEATDNNAWAAASKVVEGENECPGAS